MYDLGDLVDIALKVTNESEGYKDPYLIKHPELCVLYMRFLRDVVRKYKPAVCLELGVYMGTATAHMATACEDTCVIGVDRDFHEVSQKVSYLYPNIKFIEGESTDVSTRHKVAEALPWDGLIKERIGLMFVDSTHDGKTPTTEFLLYRPMFDEECLVVCDDILGLPDTIEDMTEFWEYLPGEKQVLHFLHPPLHESYHKPGFGISIIRQR